MKGGLGIDSLSGNDRLDDGIGIDALTGGIGDEHDIVDNASDVINEVSGESPADRVSARASYVLAADDDIEVLTTVSSSATTAINLTGNALHQDITGNSGKNILRDGAGAADLLKGRAGDDTYQYMPRPRRSSKRSSPTRRTGLCRLSIIASVRACASRS